MWPETLLKKLQHRCFSVNMAKSLRTPILKNFCKQLLLSWSCQNIFGMWCGGMLVTQTRCAHVPYLCMVEIVNFAVFFFNLRLVTLAAFMHASSES